MTTKPIIGFIGGGNMGSCLVGGLIRKGYPPASILLSDRHETRCQALQTQWGIPTFTQNEPVVEQADILILAVKPIALASTLEKMQPILAQHQPTIVSVAAGIATAQLQSWINRSDLTVVRAMPNVAAQVGQGMTALFSQVALPTALQASLSEIFNAVGEIVWIDDENWMDAITALSGSGPAYFFTLMEGLIQGACELGLPEPLAQQLTIATAIGSGALAKSNPTNIAGLRQSVTSTGGTTEQALTVLAQGQFNNLIKTALKKATEHGKKLRATYQ